MLSAVALSSRPGTPRAVESGFEFEAYIGGLGSGSTPRQGHQKTVGAVGSWDTPPPPPEEAEAQLVSMLPPSLPPEPEG